MVEWIIFLKRAAGKSAELTPLGQIESMERIIDGSFAANGKLSIAGFAALKKIIGGAGLFELTYAEGIDARTQAERALSWRFLAHASLSLCHCLRGTAPNDSGLDGRVELANNTLTTPFLIDLVDRSDQSVPEDVKTLRYEILPEQCASKRPSEGSIGRSSRGTQ